MTPQEIQSLYAYNRWADARSLEAAAALTPEQFTRNLGNSFGSVRDTLSHILGAQWIWLERWMGRSPTGFPSEISVASSVDELRVLRAPIESALSDFVTELTPARLDAAVSYRNFAGKEGAEPLLIQLQHVVNHSTYHRGQITTMLRQLGAKPLNTDFVAYYRSTKA